jgi:hypothetical protein
MTAFRDIAFPAGGPASERSCSRRRNKMSLDWISKPILCDGEVVCAALSPDEALLPMRDRIAFRAILLYHAWQAYACDGRQMSPDDMGRMDDFEVRFSDTSLDEEAMYKVVDDFGNFIPAFLAVGPVDVPQRALIWTQQGANNPMRASGEGGPN